MKLYFRNSRGQERVIAEPTDEKECHIEIQKFLDEHNFKSYYTRTWTEEDGSKWYDVGSWSEFFIVRSD
jgi:hypothetical protein